MKKMILVYDKKLMRPACVLLQVVLGGEQGIAHVFDARDWLVHTTPDMKPYTVTETELAAVVKLTKEARRCRRRVDNEH